MSHKIKESMNVSSTKKKLDGGSAFLSLTFGTRSKKCASHMSKSQSESTRNWHRICHCCQTWTEDKPILEATLVSEKKKIEMDFVTFIGFLATSQVFQADGWFMVLQGGAHVLCGPRDGPPRKHWRVILRGSKYNTTKKEALQSETVLALFWRSSRPHSTSQWVRYLRNCLNCLLRAFKEKVIDWVEYPITFLLFCQK